MDPAHSSSYGGPDPSDNPSGSGSGQQGLPNGPKPEHIRAAARAIAHCLGDSVYAIVGGAACSVLGSTRETADVDFVVPRGETSKARRMLRNESESFEVEKNTLHTYYKSDPRVEIDILAPPVMFKESFDSTTPTLLIDGVKVLKPSLILNAKCNSIISRATEGKKRTDAVDIKFCLWWCTNNNELPTAVEVPHASQEFVEWFITTYSGAEYWTDAGYNWQTWSF